MLQILPKGFLWGIVPLTGFFVGWYIDLLETKRYAIFRDKSALYGRELKEGQKPSWPTNTLF